MTKREKKPTLMKPKGPWEVWGRGRWRPRPRLSEGSLSQKNRQDGAIQLLLQDGRCRAAGLRYAYSPVGTNLYPIPCPSLLCLL